MNILITGITGFIGSHLAWKLCRSNEVYGLVRKPVNTQYLGDELKENIKFLYTDGSVESILNAVKDSMPNLTYHLATYYTGSSDFSVIPSLIESNILYGANLLEALSVTGCRKFIYASSAMQFSNGKDYSPQNLYAATKQAFSDIAGYYAYSGKIKAACVILNDTYGADDKRPKILNLIKKTAKVHGSIDLTSGRQIYNLLYVDDVVNGLVLAAEELENAKNVQHYFQLFSEGALSLKETIEKMTKLNDLTFNANWGAKPDPECQIFEPKKLFDPPHGWKQKILLEEGLKRFFEEDKRF